MIDQKVRPISSQRQKSQASKRTRRLGRLSFWAIAAVLSIVFAPSANAGRGGGSHHSAPHPSAPHPSAPHQSAPHPQVQHRSAPQPHHNPPAAHHNPPPVHHNPPPVHHNPPPAHHNPTSKPPIHHNPKPQETPTHQISPSSNGPKHHDPSTTTKKSHDGPAGLKPATSSQSLQATKRDTQKKLSPSSASTSFTANPKTTGSSASPKSAGFNAAPKISTASATPKTSGFDANPGSAGFGSNPGSAGFGSNPSSAGFGSNPSSAGFGSNPGSASFGANPGSSGFGANPGTRIGSPRVYSYLSSTGSASVNSQVHSTRNGGGNENGRRVGSGGGNRRIYLPMFMGYNSFGAGGYRGYHHRRYSNHNYSYGYPQRYYAVRRTSRRPNALVNNGNQAGSALQRLSNDLSSIAPGSQATQARKDMIAGDLMNTVEGGVQANSREIRSLAAEMVIGLAARPAAGGRSAMNFNGLAKSLASVVNSPFRPRAEVAQAVDRVLSELRTAGIGPNETQAISRRLNGLSFNNAPNDRPQVQQAASKS